MADEPEAKAETGIEYHTLTRGEAEELLDTDRGRTILDAALALTTGWERIRGHWWRRYGPSDPIRMQATRASLTHYQPEGLADSTSGYAWAEYPPRYATCEAGTGECAVLCQEMWDALPREGETAWQWQHYESGEPARRHLYQNVEGCSNDDEIIVDIEMEGTHRDCLILALASAGKLVKPTEAELA